MQHGQQTHCQLLVVGARTGSQRLGLFLQGFVHEAAMGTAMAEVRIVRSLFRDGAVVDGQWVGNPSRLLLAVEMGARLARLQRTL